SRVRLLPEAAEVARIVRAAQPDAQDQPATGQVVEGHRLARQLPGAAAGQRGDGRADADSGGGERDRRQRDPGVVGREAGLVVGDVVLEEETIPARILGDAGQLRQRPWVAALPGVRDLQAVPHAYLPWSLPLGPSMRRFPDIS